MSSKVAIVGIALRVPGASNLDDFWHNLVTEKDCLVTLSESELLSAGVPQDLVDDPNYVRRCSKLEDIDMFDAGFFGFTPREARQADPQLRLLLETAYECIENSGNNVLGQRVGVYVGAADHKYWLKKLLYDTDGSAASELGAKIHVAKDYFASQVSHNFNLTGPSISLASACSSALLAVHEACSHLLMHDCDYAIAGGCEVVRPSGYLYEEGSIESKDGIVRAFDKDANGTVFGSGVGLVMLKRLDMAVADGDHIYAVISGSGANNDGNRKVGYSAPSVQGQADVIHEAQVRAGISPEHITYIETHGTATAIGDPIEIEALQKVFGHYSDKKQYCAIGSVKTNVGHLSYAAGVAGLIKTALCLAHRKIPASLHFQEQNSSIKFEDTAFYVNAQLQEWSPPNGKRYAGVSAFGIGGTNVHVVLEQGPDMAPPIEAPASHVFTLSAKTQSALSLMCANLAKFVEERQHSRLLDIAYTLNTGRPNYQFRWAGVSNDRQQLVEMLNDASTLADYSENALDEAPPVVFMLPGQGAQYPNMGKDLYDTFTAFREAVDECVAIANEHLDIDLFRVIYPSEESGPEKQDQINQTAYTQPAVFVVSYALCKQLGLWGIKPDMLIGHSLGEYVAACLSGVFALEDAVKLVCARGRLMQSLPAGEMISVSLGVEELEAFISPQIDIAATNSPHSTVLSGTSEEIQKIQELLTRSNIKFQALRTSHAFHSRMMDPILDEFRSLFSEVRCGSPSTPIMSNVSGDLLTDGQAMNPDYWVTHLRSTVCYSEAIEKLDSSSVLLEVGPGRALSGSVLLSPTSFPLVANSMKRGNESQSDIETILSCLGKLWCNGIGVDWSSYFEGSGARKTPLPTYPFERERYWFDAVNSADATKHNKIKSTLTKQAGWDPLLGNTVAKSVRSRVYENVISENCPEYLADHKLLNTTIFPGAGYVSMTVSVASELLNSSTLVVEEISFDKALMLLPDQHKNIQVTGYLLEENSCYVDITSSSSAESSSPVWNSHAQAKVSVLENHNGKSCDLEKIKGSMSKQVSVEEYYGFERLIRYGKSFKALQEIYTANREVLAKISLPSEVATSHRGFAFHPVLLDACFQATDVLFQEIGVDTLPTGLKNLSIWHEIPTTVWVYVRASGSNHGESEDASISIQLIDETGNRVAEIEEYLQGQLNEEELSTVQSDNILFSLKWVKEAAAARKVELHQKSDWLVFPSKGGIGEQLVRDLRSHNQQVYTFTKGNEKSREGGRFSRSAASDSKFLELLKGVDNSQNSGRSKILYLWALDESKDSMELCLEVVNLVKAVTELNLTKPPQLFLFTLGAQPVSLESLMSLTSVSQSALWGLGNSISREHPELDCVRIDLDPNPDAESNLSLSLEDISLSGREDQIAYRGGCRYFLRVSEYVAENAQTRLQPVSNSYAVGMAQYGTFDNFRVLEKEEHPPLGTQVQVGMHAVGINFKETLIALGVLEKEIPQSHKTQFGLEGAGKIVAIGKEVEDFSVGDDVIVWHPGCLGSDVVVDQGWLVPMPANLDYIQAAVIPTVFMTAYHALYNLAKIKKGEKVLIHAAAGGVGQAAIQIAKHVGAEIYATCSKGKQEYLRSKGIECLMDSRSLEFSKQILNHTSGTGVDIVLNSLSGDYIQHSIDALGKNGRFVEIGKAGIWPESKLKSYRPDVAYYPFELGEEDTSGVENYRSLMSSVLEGFSSGILSVPPISEFDIRDTKQAFRYLASGKSIGKVALSFPSSPSGSIGQSIDWAGCYLVTGGLGGIGLRLAEWLAAKGASRIVLLGRSEPNKKAVKRIERITRRGCKVDVQQCDVSNFSQMKALFDRQEECKECFTGVFHCAGALEDGVILRQSKDAFKKVFSPKVDGALILHELTKDKKLKFFVCFSSISSIFDCAGQSNYAAANSFLDGLVHHRVQLGLPGLSVNWGGWAGEGMTAELVDEGKISPENLLRTQEAFSALERLMAANQTQALVVRIGDRLKREPGPLFDDFDRQSQEDDATALEIDKVISMNPTNTFSENALLYLQTEISKILGFDEQDEVGIDDEFVDLGVDSLMLIELKNRVQSGIGEELPIGLFFSHPTPQHLANYMDEKFADKFVATRNDHNPSLGDGNGWRVDDFCFHKEAKEKILFCLPGINDNIMEFSDLSEKLKDSHRVQTLQLVTENGKLPESLNDLATLYVDRMISIQPEGEYSIAGFSYGGTLAVEIVHQLLISGKEVDLLLMIDAAPHFHLKEYEGFIERLLFIIFDGIMNSLSIEESARESFVNSIRNTSARVMKDKFLQFIFENGNSFGSDTMSTIAEIIDRCESKIDIPYLPPRKLGTLDIQFIRATRPISNSLQFFESEMMVEANKLDDYGWGEILENTFQITKLDCDHNSALREGNVGSIAQLVLEII